MITFKRQIVLWVYYILVYHMAKYPYKALKKSQVQNVQNSVKFILLFHFVV